MNFLLLISFFFFVFSGKCFSTQTSIKIKTRNFMLVVINEDRPFLLYFIKRYVYRIFHFFFCFQNIVAGLTLVDWESIDNLERRWKRDEKAVLIRVTPTPLLLPIQQKKDNAIQCFSGYGPCFGFACFFSFFACF